MNALSSNVQAVVLYSLFQIRSSFFISYIDASKNTGSELERRLMSQNVTILCKHTSGQQRKECFSRQGTLQLNRFLNQRGQYWNHLGSQYIFHVLVLVLFYSFLKWKDALCSGTQTISTKVLFTAD